MVKLRAQSMAIADTWFDTAIAELRTTRPLVGDAVASRLSSLLAGRFRERAISPKDVVLEADALLREMPTLVIAPKAAK